MKPDSGPFASASGTESGDKHNKFETQIAGHLLQQVARNAVDLTCKLDPNISEEKVLAKAMDGRLGIVSPTSRPLVATNDLQLGFQNCYF